MKYFIIALCVALFTASIFLIAKYGVRRKESKEFLPEDFKF